MQRTLYLATTKYGRDLLLEGLLPRPQFVGQPKLHIEVTMVDGAQFPSHGAGR